MNVRAALTFSLAVALCCVGVPEYVELKSRLGEDPEPQAVFDAVKSSPVASHPEIREVLAEGADEENASYLLSIVSLRARLETTPPSLPDAATGAEAIKQSPLYRDPGVQETSNWLSRALARLRNISWNPKMSGPSMPSFPLLGQWLYYAMWFLIALAITILLFLGVRHIRWRGRLTRRASALLEESEPERSLDEWLAEADRLESEGEYRRAVRALYLACLLRFDEAMVARFDRSETNWEHLARIEASPKRPPEVDFRSPTQLFDRVWYGRIVRGREDALQFREWYVELAELLRRRAA